LLTLAWFVIQGDKNVTLSLKTLGCWPKDQSSVQISGVCNAAMEERTCEAKSKHRQTVHFLEIPRAVVPVVRDAADDGRAEGIPLGRPPLLVVVLAPDAAKLKQKISLK
jgi:hypothetical protein